MVLQNKKDFTSQIGEWLVSEIYAGSRAESGTQKDWDIKCDDEYIQVKAHAKAETTTAKWTPIKYPKEANIDILIIIVFSPNYKIKQFYRVPWDLAFKKIRQHSDKPVIYWKDISEFEISAEKLPNQEVVSLFQMTND